MKNTRVRTIVNAYLPRVPKNPYYNAAREQMINQLEILAGERVYNN